MITCSRCGFENPESNRFCQNCGVNLSEAIDPPKFDASQTSPIALSKSIVPDLDKANLPKDEPNETSQKHESQDVVDELIREAIALETAIMNAPDPSTSNLDDNLAELENISPQLSFQTSDQITEPQLDELPDRQNEKKELSASDLNLLDTILTPIDRLSKPINICLTSIAHAGLTDVGKLRDHNEDNFMICHQVMTLAGKDQAVKQVYRSLFVLCDGMGGHAGGELASSMAIASITKLFQPFWTDDLPGEQKLKDIILATNQEIYDRNEQELRNDLGRMGTTLAIMAVHNTQVAIAHVGDSRIYKITQSSIEPQLQQITRDHEVANRLIDQGVDAEIAIARYDAHQLTQAIGPNGNFHLSPSIQFFSICEPTLFLLCSDGLCDNDVIEQNWQTHLLPYFAPDTDLQAGLKALIALGNEQNGHDNITAILVNCQVETINS
jgi:serine/threonine protein phosphatase PrpC